MLSKTSPVLRPAQPQQRCVQPDVLQPRKVAVESRAEFQQRRHTSSYRNRAFGRLAQAGRHAEQRTLAGSVSSDHGHAFALIQAEGDVLQSIKNVSFLLLEPIQQVAPQEFGPAGVREDFGDAFELDQSHSLQVIVESFLQPAKHKKTQNQHEYGD